MVIGKKKPFKNISGKKRGFYGGLTRGVISLKFFGIKKIP